jgi:hypothetical protein
MEVTIFYNLITEVVSFHFCLSLLIKDKLIGTANLQGEGIPQGHE